MVDPFGDAFALGNPVLMGVDENAEDNGQPFVIAYVPQYPAVMTGSLDTEPTSHTVKVVSTVTTQEIHKLDNKFLDMEWIAKPPVGYETLAKVEETTVITELDDERSGAPCTRPVGVECDMTKLLECFDLSTGNWKKEINIVVKLDGVDYCLNPFYEFFGSTIFTISGGEMWGDIPFFGFIDAEVCALFFPTAGEHTISIDFRTPIYEKIPMHYLPDNLGSSSTGGTSLPEVTTNDNGKSLSVVDGNWQVKKLSYNDLENKPTLGTLASKDGLTASEVGAVPTSRTINGKSLSSNITLSASDIGADSSGTATSIVSMHNTGTSAHNDIRTLISNLTTRLNALADSDDTTLDQMSEIVTYIKNNKTLIENVTTNKVNVSDIINNLTTNVSNKPLSAAQGVALKSLIDSLQTAVNDKASKNDLSTHTGNTTNHVTSSERTSWNAAKTHADSTHAPINAEKNQNAFSNVNVLGITIQADTTTDTLTLAGSNVTLTPDAPNDKITIGITKDNVISALGYTPPAQDTTYSEATTTTAGLMSAADKTKLDSLGGTSAGAVLYTEQELTDVQKRQARTNIDAVAESELLETTFSDTVTWDGNTENRDNTYDVYKIADINSAATGAMWEAYSTNSALPATLTSNTGETVVLQPVMANGRDGVGIFIYSNNSTHVYCIPNEVAQDMYFPSGGVYFSKASDDYFPTSFTIEGFNFAQKTVINPSLIPPVSNISSWNDLTDKPFGETLGDTLTWNGNTEGLQNTGNLYLISDVILTPEELSQGGSITTSDGNTETWSEPSNYGDGICIWFTSTGEVVAVIYDNSTTPDSPTGIIFSKDPTTGAYVSSFTINGCTKLAAVNTIPSKYLPANIGSSGGNSGSSLPTVTTSDNGKSLRVVNGNWSVDKINYNDLNNKPTIPTVDTAMSSTSTNAVQNKVIKSYIDNAVSNVKVTTDTSMSSTSTNAVQNKVIKAYVDDAIATAIGNAIAASY